MTAAPDLTILLGLKDRVPFTLRWLSYCEAVRFPFPLWLADGGSENRLARLLADRRSVPGVDYEYVRYAPDTSYTDYWRKMADSLARIRTPFVALADNDDLFLVTGLTQAVRFLADHPDYATCGGQTAVFWIAPSNAEDDEERFCYGTNVLLKYSLDARSLEDETARDRIRHHSRRATHPAHYHVRRTEQFRRMAETIRDMNLEDPFLIERTLAFLTATAGKIKQLNTMYIARQWNAPGSDAIAHQRRHGDWFGRMLVPSWSQDFTTFVNVCSAALGERDRLSRDEAREAVIQLYREWMAPQLLGDLLQEPTVTLPMALGVQSVRRLLARPPQSLVRRAARAIYRRTRWISVDALHGLELRARGVPRARQAFSPVGDFLRSHA